MNYEKFQSDLNEKVNNHASGEEMEAFICEQLALANDEKDYYNYVLVANDLLIFYLYAGMFDKAFKAGEDILMLLEEFNMDQTEDFANTVFNIGFIYERAGRLEDAGTFYLRALNIYDQIYQPDDVRFYDICFQMAALLLRVGQYDSALYFAKRADSVLAYEDEFNIKRAQCKAIIGTVEGYNGKIEDADIILSDAVSLFETSKDREQNHYYSVALAGIGQCSMEKGDYSRAGAYYAQAAYCTKILYGENEAYHTFMEKVEKAKKYF